MDNSRNSLHDESIKSIMNNITEKLDHLSKQEAIPSPPITPNKTRDRMYIE